MVRRFWILLRREFGAILLSPIAYVLFICLTLVTGYMFLESVYVVVDAGIRGYGVIEVLVQLFYFWFMLVLLVPVLTMRLFSEEYKSGTIEPLLTVPVDEWEVILAKFSAAVVVLLIMLSPTMLYAVVFYAMAWSQTPPNLVALGMTYGIVLLVSMFWISIGLFTSSLTRNQIVAAMMSFTLIALVFFIGFQTDRVEDVFLREMVGYIYTLEHVREFARGFFDTRPVVFYLSGTALFLALTHRVLLSYRHKL